MYITAVAVLSFTCLPLIRISARTVTKNFTQQRVIDVTLGTRHTWITQHLHVRILLSPKLITCLDFVAPKPVGSAGAYLINNIQDNQLLPIRSVPHPFSSTTLTPPRHATPHLLFHHVNSLSSLLSITFPPFFFCHVPPSSSFSYVSPSFIHPSPSLLPKGNFPHLVPSLHTPSLSPPSQEHKNIKI